jgi:GNAT superfamily N-acetyltransferase
MKITYQTGLIPDTKHIVEVYRSSGIKRPVEDLARIANMYTNSNIIVTAWAGKKLVGISRSITDFYYCCYLSDLAVRKEYQKTGIGSELIALTRERIGDQVALILVSAPEAIDYYPKVGFDKIDNGYMIKRSK